MQSRLLLYMTCSIVLCAMYIPLHSAEIKEPKAAVLAHAEKALDLLNTLHKTLPKNEYIAYMRGAYERLVDAYKGEPDHTTYFNKWPSIAATESPYLKEAYKLGRQIYNLNTTKKYQEINGLLPQLIERLSETQRYIEHRLAINKKLNTELLPELDRLTKTDVTIRLIEAVRDIVNNAISNKKLSQLQSIDATVEQSEDASKLIKKLTHAIVALYQEILDEKYDKQEDVYGTALNGIDQLISFCEKKIKALSARKIKMERALSIFDKNQLEQYRQQHATQFKEFEQSISLRNDILEIEKTRVNAAFESVQKIVLPELNAIQNIPENSPLFFINEFYRNTRNLLKFSENNFEQLNFANGSPLLQNIVTPTKEMGKKIVKGQSEGTEKLADQVVDAIRKMINVRKNIISLQGPYRVRTDTSKIDAPWYSYAWSAAKSIIAPTKYTLKELIAQRGVEETPALKTALDDYDIIMQDPAFEQKADTLEKAQNAVSVIKDIVFPTQQKLAPQLAQKEELVGKLTTIQQQYADLDTQLVRQIKKEASEETINALQEKMNTLKRDETRLEQEITKNAGLVSRGINTRNLEAMAQSENNYKNKIVSFFEAEQPPESFKNQIKEIQNRMRKLIQKSNPEMTSEVFNKNYQDVLDLLQTLDAYLESIKKISAIRAIIEKVENTNTFEPISIALNSLLEKQAHFKTSASTKQLLSELKNFSLDLTNLYNSALQKDDERPIAEKIASTLSTKAENIGAGIETIRTGVENAGAGLAAVQDAAATASKNIETAKIWYHSIANALAMLKTYGNNLPKAAYDVAIHALQFFKNKIVP